MIPASAVRFAPFCTIQDGDEKTDRELGPSEFREEALHMNPKNARRNVPTGSLYGGAEGHGNRSGGEFGAAARSCSRCVCGAKSEPAAKEPMVSAAEA